MKHKWLIVSFVAQFLLIGFVFLNAYLPVFFGYEVKVKASGYDPRDLLAGNFVRLDYGIRLKEDESVQDVNTIFVLLDDADNDGIFQFGQIVFDEPKTDVFLKAKPAYKWSPTLNIGAEKYFASKQKALQLEKSLNNDNFSALVTLKIYKGKARIVDLELIENNASKQD